MDFNYTIKNEVRTFTVSYFVKNIVTVHIYGEND